MKRALALAAVVGLAPAAFGQGVIYRNEQSPSGAISRPYLDDGAGHLIPVTGAPAGATITTPQITCGTTPTLVYSAGPAKAFRGVSNFSATDLYIGDNTITASSGSKIPVGFERVITGFNGPLYCASPGGTGVVTLTQY